MNCSSLTNCVTFVTTYTFWDYLAAFVLGAIVGSFLNVVMLRLRSGMSFVIGTSQCLSCGTKLRWFELIPIVSFLIQRGRCTTCHAKLFYQYPLVELTSGLVFVLVLGRSGILLLPDVSSVMVFVLSLVFWSVALVIAGYDARHKIIPDELSILLGLIGIIFAFTDTGVPAIVSISCGFTAALFYGALWLVSKGKWMGLGDAKLAFGLGTFLGWPMVVLGNLFGFWIGAIWGVIFMLTGKYNRKSELPFGPFLIIGAFIAYYAGDILLEWYIMLIGL